MNSVFTFEAEPFPTGTVPQASEFSSGPWHPRLGPGRSIPRTAILEELPLGRRAYHRSLGPGRIIAKTAVLSETADELELIGTDDRVQVLNTAAVPFRWICALDLFFPDPDNPANLMQFAGSGTLISPRHVLTAGHCLFDSVDGSAGTSARLAVSAITVAPGRNGGTNTLGSTTMQSFQVNATWRASLNALFDYGLITLRDTIGDQAQSALAGRPLGFWGSPSRGAGTIITPRSQASLNKQPVNISGYPADKPSGTQWRAFGKIVNTSPAAGAELIYYDLDTCGGHSGSPIWLRTGQTRNLIAIHTGSCLLGPDCTVVSGTPCFPDSQRRSSNRGVRISSSVLQNVVAWMSGTPGTRPTLRRGSKGPFVIELQTRLNAWQAANPSMTLAPLVVDGDFGPKTQAMVISFQRNKGLTVDGVFGPQTWGALLAI